MKTRTIILTAAFVAIIGATGFSQSLQKGSAAKLNYNADKSGSLNTGIHYNSSFFVTDYTASNDVLAATAQRLKSEIAKINNLQLAEMDDKKTLMIVIDVKADNGTELSEQFRKLFTELGVETVLYNESPVKTTAFKF